MDLWSKEARLKISGTALECRILQECRPYLKPLKLFLALGILGSSRKVAFQ